MKLEPDLGTPDRRPGALWYSRHRSYIFPLRAHKAEPERAKKPRSHRTLEIKQGIKIPHRTYVCTEYCTGQHSALLGIKEEAYLRKPKPESTRLGAPGLHDVTPNAQGIVRGPDMSDSTFVLGILLLGFPVALVISFRWHWSSGIQRIFSARNGALRPESMYPDGEDWELESRLPVSSASIIVLLRTAFVRYNACSYPSVQYALSPGDPACSTFADSRMRVRDEVPRSWMAGRAVQGGGRNSQKTATLLSARGDESDSWNFGRQIQRVCPE